MNPMGYYQAGDYYAAGFNWQGALNTAVDVVGGIVPQWLDRGARQVSGLGSAPPFSMTPGGLAAVAAGTSSPARAARAGRGGGGGYRRMNPGNFRALRRSMRRLKSFEKAARQVYHFVKPAAHHSRFKFPHKKKR
jgi:hypothetical protein